MNEEAQLQPENLKHYQIASKEEFFETRYQNLSALFQEMGINMTDYLSERDFLQLLDSLTARQFDREIARGLFSKIPKQDNPQKPYEKVLEVEAFVHTFIKAEYLLLIKADQIEQKLEDVAGQIDAIGYHIEAMRNSGNVDGRENTLNLEIAEVVSDDFDRKDPPNTRYTAVVKYEGYKYETAEVTNEGPSFNPNFEHTFHLRIKNLKDKFVVCLRKYDDSSNRMAYKETTAKFSFDLADTNRNEAWIELFDENRNYTKEKMHLVVELEPIEENVSDDIYEKLEKLQIIHEDLLDERDLIFKSLADLVEPFSVRGGASTNSTVPQLELPYIATDVNRNEASEANASRISESKVRRSNF